MTVMSRIPARRPKQRRSSFVPPTSRGGAVPDVLSWREQLDRSVAPKGQAAWTAASTARSDRTVIDAGPYGVIDLAVMDPAAERGRNQRLGVVWWDKRSYREDDDDVGTIQTGFVPASIADHVSLGRSPTRSAVPALHPVAAAIAEGIAGANPVAADARPRHGPVHASPAPPAAVEQPIAPPVLASRPAELDGSEQVRHARRSRHVALVPQASGRQAQSSRRRRRSRETVHPRRTMLRRRRTRRRVILSMIIVVIAFAVTVLVQSSVITPFTVPSVSMQGTLQTGDRILVDKLGSAPSSIHRGDVVVFTDPGGWIDGSADKTSGRSDDFLVKRVIGVPGDHVTCCSTTGRVTVNGIELYESYAVVPTGQPAAASSFDVTVPAGALWVLGDNRYNSRDSTQTQGLPSKGFVPIADVVGQAVVTLWPLNRLSTIGSAEDTFASVPDQTCPI